MSRTRHHGDRAKKKLYGDNWHWMACTPSHWTHDFMTVPARRATRDKLAKVKRDRADDGIWPLARKPHVYYW